MLPHSRWLFSLLSLFLILSLPCIVHERIGFDYEACVVCRAHFTGRVFCADGKCDLLSLHASHHSRCCDGVAWKGGGFVDEGDGTSDRRHPFIQSFCDSGAGSFFHERRKNRRSEDIERAALHHARCMRRIHRKDRFSCHFVGEGLAPPVISLEGLSLYAVGVGHRPARRVTTAEIRSRAIRRARLVLHRANPPAQRESGTFSGPPPAGRVDFFKMPLTFPLVEGVS